MFNSTSNADIADVDSADADSAHSVTDVIVPLIRAAATIGFAIAPCSLGFVIIAVSEQLIRAIMVGDDPEMLVSALQTQFPNTAIRVNENLDTELVAKVVDVLERSEQALHLPLEVPGLDFQMRVWDALHEVPAGTTANYTFLAEHVPT